MSIQITLNKPDNRYIAGEVLQGNVTINNTKEEKVRSVYILIKGAAEVKWTERESYRSNNETKYRDVTYSSHEQYLNSQTVLFGQIDGPTIKFPAGGHTYNFACALPERLPGTMRTSEASIKYKVKLVMDVPWGIDTTKSHDFEVVNVIDLNHNLSLKLPVQLEELKSFCLCSCAPTEAALTVTVPKGGYVPNEEISIHCRVNNRTNVEFYGATFILQRIVTATTVSPHRKSRETKDELAHTEITLIDRDTKNKEFDLTGKIKVPVCPVSCHYAAYIETVYVVKVEFEVGGCHTNVTMRVPIEIGTIPLVSSGTGIAIAPMAPLAPIPDVSGAQVPSAPPAGVLNEEKVPLADPPPPTYSEATKTEKEKTVKNDGIGGATLGWNVE